MSAVCNNCGEPIRLKHSTARRRMVWTATRTGAAECPERPRHVGHIPASAYKVTGLSGRKR